MRENKPVKICPICHKAYTNRDGARISPTCSLRCGVLFAQHDKHSQRRLNELAAERKRPPRTDCISYVEGGLCCGLTALWCVYEDCKFFKPREDDDE